MWFIISMHIILEHFNRIFEHLLKVNFLRRKIWSFALHHDSYCILLNEVLREEQTTQKSHHISQQLQSKGTNETKCQIQKIQDILIIILFTVVENWQKCLIWIFHAKSSISSVCIANVKKWDFWRIFKHCVSSYRVFSSSDTSVDILHSHRRNRWFCRLFADQFFLHLKMIFDIKTCSRNYCFYVSNFRVSRSTKEFWDVCLY